MKTITKFIKLCSVFLFLYSMPAYTQSYFQVASATESTVTPTGCRKTGNDILDRSSVTYRVFTWDNGGTNAKLGWRVTSGGTTYAGTANLGQTSNVTELDVCLVVGGSDVFAIVAYFVDGGTDDYYWDYFKWNSTSTSFVSQASNQIYSSPSSINTTLNIDGAENGDFAIVWDDATNGIEGITGQIVSSVPNLNGNKTGLQSGTFPDISIFYDGTSSHLYVGYIDANAKLTVDYYDFGWGSYGNQLNDSPTYTYRMPRIASPNRNNGIQDDWTIVTEENNGSVYRILGKTSQGGSVGSLVIYNTFFYSGVGNYPNLNPAVTYDSQSTESIWVGWTMNNSSGGLSGNPPQATQTAIYPVGVELNSSGAVQNSKYWDVPTTICQNCTYDYLSLSGRHAANGSSSEKVFITFYNSNYPYIITKEINPGTATSFKISDDGSVLFAGDPLQETGNNPSAQNLHYTLYDLSGKLYVSENGSAYSLVNHLRDLKQSVPESVWLLKVISEDGKINFSQKVQLGFKT